ncbi:EamA family transporter [Actinoallomurus soli]|uniref:EamA family transporter n=1 Tax=Actinoallomurus soli TaxID=2952535 RepID=UPI0020922038|nr:EamA family transporter [Actinoallomurus soli]MCO5971771.1 EamA family transporter [Actinoallomurus soli]
MPIGSDPPGDTGPRAGAVHGDTASPPGSARGDTAPPVGAVHGDTAPPLGSDRGGAAQLPGSARGGRASSRGPSRGDQPSSSGSAGGGRRAAVPPWAYFIGSAVFHYLGPSFAVLLFARVGPLGVAGLRIWSAALVFALWRRPWRVLGGAGRRLLLAWGLVLAVMNACFYLAIARLPLGTVAAIEFLPVIALAALGTRTTRNLAALVAVVGGVYVLTDVRLSGRPLGFVFAFANAALFAGYIVIAHRAARRFPSGIDGLAAAMLVAAVCVLPLGAWQAVPALADPVALAAGIGVGVASSVIPYVCDQLAMARMARATYALLVALLPAAATVIGAVVLGQVPSPAEAAGVALVITGVALHRERR